MISPFVLEAQKASLLIRHTVKKIGICCVCKTEYKIIHPTDSDHYCSPECRKKDKIYEYKCTVCGKLFIRKVYSKSINIFCDEKCRWKHSHAIAKAKKLKRTKWI